MKMYKSIIKFIKRIIFPPSCVFCKRMIEINSRSNVCGKCGNSIEFTYDKTCCLKCGKPIIGYTEKQLCYFCIHNGSKYFDRIISVFIYDDLVRDSIIRFKRNGYNDYADTYVECMVTKFYEEYNNISFDFICGVASNDKRNHKKDFDQVDLLCKKLSKILNISYRKNIFSHLRNTAKQSTLGYEERQNNMKYSLTIASETNVSEKTILLIDDICTTRATIIECARALKKAGAKRVYALTVATVNNPE